MTCNRKFSRAEILKGWLELTRLPNLFTVPGDILAGASMALFIKKEIPFILPAIVISLSLYISGLMLNDFFDRKTDCLERPDRPIPSGRISHNTTLISGISFILIALTLSSIYKKVFWISLCLIFLILFYNGFARKIPLLGIIVMGLCRGMNLLLGAFICSSPINNMVLTGAIGETLYIASVTNLACHETKDHPVGIKVWFPLISLLIIFPILVLISNSSKFGIFMCFIAMCWIFFIQLQIRKKMKKLSKSIGDLIRALVLIQCALIALSMEKNPVNRHYYLIGIIILFLFFIISDLSAKKFYGS
ncbi:MAG: UbiA family prenyltransferase [bacterium]